MVNKFLGICDRCASVIVPRAASHVRLKNLFFLEIFFMRYNYITKSILCSNWSKFSLLRPKIEHSYWFCFTRFIATFNFWWRSIRSAWAKLVVSGKKNSSPGLTSPTGKFKSRGWIRNNLFTNSLFMSKWWKSRPNSFCYFKYRLKSSWKIFF